MRRADRLFQTVQILRSRRLTTGALLADRLGVSLRTVYRDIRDLQSSGMPIYGEAGSGYTLAERIDLPPLLFSREELVALQFGLRVATQWGDAGLQQAAQGALEKVVGALPRDRRRAADNVPLFASGAASPLLAPLRAAVERRQKVRLAYADENGGASERRVWPLGLMFWGRTWTLTAWCELRGAFRDFRIDRIAGLDVDDAVYPQESGRTLADYWLQLEREHGVSLPAEWRDNFGAGAPP